jgi:flagellar export protein FliJ
MPFRFSLATVLRVRESVQRQEERALQKILFEMARVTRHIDRLTVEISAAFNEEERAMQRPIPAGQVQVIVSKKQAAIEKRTALSNQRQALEKERDRQLQIYHAAYRNSETLIELRNTKRDEYEQEKTRADQKRLDDIFASRRQRS